MASRLACWRPASLCHETTPGSKEGVNDKLPVYVYRCEQCGRELEKRQSFSDAPLTECEACHGALRKVLSPAAIIYKGSGFYSTDHNGKSGARARGDSSDTNGTAEQTPAKPTSESKEPAAATSSKED